MKKKCEIQPMSLSDIYTQAAQNIFSREETFSCSAVERLSEDARDFYVEVMFSDCRRRKSKTDPSWWVGPEIIPLSTDDEDGLRVMLLLMMAACCEDFRSCSFSAHLV